MKIVQQKHEVWGECPLHSDAETFKMMEHAGRMCYQSQHRITEDSWRPFLDRMFKSRHSTVFEFGILAYAIEYPPNTLDPLLSTKALFDSKYFDIAKVDDSVFIVGSYRAWMEWGVMHVPYTNHVDFADCLEEHYTQLRRIRDNGELPWQLRRIAVQFTTDRAVTHELVRHRPMSFLQKSQRYCADRSDLEVIIPYMYEPSHMKEDQQLMNNYHVWVSAVEYAEKVYHQLLRNGEKPQEARSVLPNCTSSDIVAYASTKQWEHIFRLRTAPAAYPQMVRLMMPWKDEYESNWKPLMDV